MTETDKILEQAAELRKLYDEGKIIESEFNELIEDLSDIKKLEEQLEVEDAKIFAEELVKAIQIAAKLV